VVLHIDVLCAQVVLVVMREHDSHLIVGEQSGGGCDVAKYLRDKAAKPQGVKDRVRDITHPKNPKPKSSQSRP